MHKIIQTLAILSASVAMAAAPKSVTLSIPSNTASAVTGVAVGDMYNYSREVDGVRFTVAGKTETNVVIVATVGQPYGSVTNTMGTYSFDRDVSRFVFPRNIITTNHLERFDTDAVTLSCACVWATNTAISTTLTNPVSIIFTIKTK